MLYKTDTVNLGFVELRSKIHQFCFLASDDGAKVILMKRDDFVFGLYPFVKQYVLMRIYFPNEP